MIGVYSLASGELAEVVASLSGVDLTGRGTRNRPEAYSAESWSWSASARDWVQDAAKVEADLIAQIDRQREKMRAAVMTQGVGQSYAYAQKANEVYDYRNIVGSLLATLTVPQRTARYPFAMAEVTATGDTLATVIARFEAGMASSRSRIAAVEAAAVKAKRAIRAASTATAKRAAYQATTWP
jgi:hypothetical protein